MATAVLDSSVVLMILNQEGGADDDLDRFRSGLLSTVNLAEVHTELDEWDVSDRDAREMLDALDLVAVDFDGALAMRAGRLRRTTEGRGLSLGDRACLSLAQRDGLPAYTCDRRWAEVPNLGIEIRLVR